MPAPAATQPGMDDDDGSSGHGPAQQRLHRADELHQVRSPLLTHEHQPPPPSPAADRIPGPPVRPRHRLQFIGAVRRLVIPFVRAADDAAVARASSRLLSDAQHNVLVDARRPSELAARLAFALPDQGRGQDGLLDAIRSLLRCSVKTWDQGFLDKLYASNTPVGLIADMVLSALNTNAHVYQASPALNLVEKATARALASRFGFDGPRAGGFTCPGGSASNLTSLVVARNTLYPDCKVLGCAGRAFVLFTSAHGHYSVAKSAMI